MSAKEEKLPGLPENAARELKPGEVYEPVMSPLKKYNEVTPYSVVWGLLMAVLFSAAAAYLGLKVGQVFEAAIPIAIIAVGVSAATKRKNALGENIIIQSIGSSSGVIVAGTIFTIPALYILQAKYPDIHVSFLQVFLSSALGGFLGILFLIPFRKYFVADMHGKYPFPEATATTQVLISGEKGGNQAKPLIIAGLIGGLYDFICATFSAWHEVISSRAIEIGNTIADKWKMVVSVNSGAAVLGLGYIIGLKYAIIICAGSFLVWFLIVPLMSGIWSNELFATLNPLTDMRPEDIFTNYARSIGIGGIAMAGLIGIVKSWGVIKSAVGLAGKELSGKGVDKSKETLRTQRDLSMKFVSIASFVTLFLILAFFYFGVIHNIVYALVGWIVVTIIAFLFTTVAANAIAIVGSNPVSGMTLMTLILASVVLVSVGLKGTEGMVTALIMGGVVCTALSMAGGFITDLKIGYWLGTTPAKQESWKFLGAVVSAATVAGVLIILNKTYGFTGDNALVAPQANAMASVIDPLMSGGSAPWVLYGVGAILALLLTWIGIPALPFALGMFIPIWLNTPLLIGGAISWFVSTRSKDADVNKARFDRGTLLASGFIAGGALMGVVSAILKFTNVDLTIKGGWLDNPMSQVVSLFVYLLLIGYLLWDSMKAKK